MLAAITHARDNGRESFTLVSHSFELINRRELAVNKIVRRRFTGLVRALATMRGAETGSYADNPPPLTCPTRPSQPLPASAVRTGTAAGRAIRLQYALRRALGHSAHATAAIDFTLGSRRLLSVPRQLATWSFSLEEVLARTLPASPGPDGLRVLSAPSAQHGEIAARFPGFVAGGRQDYRHHYIDMGQNFEAYLARFSGKTRSTLRRKAKKLAEDCRGTTVTEHRTPREIEAFLAAALPLSACTYQARLLDAGGGRG